VAAKRRALLFDLNVEKILDHWGVPEAVREVIANALDEQALSGTAERRSSSVRTAGTSATSAVVCATST